jgi:hypothetical protein
MKNVIKYSLPVLALALLVSSRAKATPTPIPSPIGPATPKHGTAPEVDPAVALTGLTLLGGAITVLRSRRRS